MGEKEKGKGTKERKREKIDKARWALMGEYGGGDGGSWVFSVLFFEHEYFKDGRIVKVLSDSQKRGRSEYCIN